MYLPFDKVIFRTPYYPTDLLRNALSDSKEFDLVISSAFFKKAIYYASPDLYDELVKYLNKELKGKDEIRTKNSLVKYLSRMSTRCTPFGLFASCSTATLGQKTEIIADGKTTAHVRFDMLYLCNLSQKLMQIEEVRRSVKYFINSTIYPRGDKLRYIEYRFDTQKRVYQLVEVSTNSYLKSILNAAQNGTCIEDMISLLTSSDEDIPADMASSYINSLIDSQILVSEIDPIITGDDFFDHIIYVLKKAVPDSDIYGRLKEISELLEQLNGEETDSDIVHICTQIENIIKSINTPYSRKFLLQVDSVREMRKATLDKDLITSLQGCMAFLNKLSPPAENGNLKAFKENFNKRYEEQEIPLMEALDPELGIGYPANQVNDISPLIAGLNLPARRGDVNLRYATTPLTSILSKKIMAFNPNKDKAIILNDDDAKGFTANWNNLPATIYVITSLVKKGKDLNGSLLKLNGFGGSSAGNLLGRFAYCDKGTNSLVEEIVGKEKEIYSDHIVAEISHIPDSRVGNVLARPNIRDYEIVYLANTTRSRKEVIYPSDILISVKNNQIRLRSKSLNRYIIPRLTTAHNFQNNPTPIYRFLCELQTQNIRGGMFFNWGALDQQLDYLPQVRYNNIILSLARWKVSVKDMEHLIKEKDEAKRSEAVKLWRNKLSIPQYVTLSDSDNTLYVDMDNPISINAFFSTIAKRTHITLDEFIYDRKHPFISNEKKESFTNECIVSFYKAPMNDKK